MAEANDDDIIISVVEGLRNARGNRDEFTVEFDSIDANYALPEGSTAKHLEAAAEDLGCDVVRKGAVRASLRKKSNFGFA